MLKLRYVFLIVAGGFILSGVFALIAFFIERLTLPFFLLALATLVINLMFAQLAYVFHALRKDTYDRQQGMTSCPECGRSIYKNDEHCPHCNAKL